MSDLDYDLFVIGAGSGGVRAARMAAGFGARVAVAEDRYMGGTCVNVGCVPKKLYVYASEYGKHFEDARGFGWDSVKPAFDWSTLRDNKKTEIARLNAIYDRLLDGAGCEVIDGPRAHHRPEHGRRGRAPLHAPQDPYRHRRLALQAGFPRAGNWPSPPTRSSTCPSFPSVCWSWAAAISPWSSPASSTASARGSRSCIADRCSCVALTRDIRAHAAQEIRKSGVDLRFEINITALRRVAGGLEAELSDGSRMEVDAVLCAAGRRPNLEGLGLENTGVKLTSHGTIEVDEHFRTAEQSIFALGDVIGGMELTPVALAEGMAFARREFAGIDRACSTSSSPPPCSRSRTSAPSASRRARRRWSSARSRSTSRPSGR
jgi:glutathione reductase (NADPH)